MSKTVVIVITYMSQNKMTRMKTSISDTQQSHLLQHRHHQVHGPRLQSTQGT